MSIDQLELEHFVALVGDTFTADFGDEGSLDLELTEATERPTGNPGDRAFSVVFRGPADRVFDQTMVELRHDVLGIHHIFLVPIAHGEDGRLYEAVFTRLGD